jgi:PAS domain S-box-containing protein
MISVLCVDDDSAILELTKIFLEEPGELTVTTALSAREALKIMETNRFDAIVSDYQMPGMDGMEFLKAVRGLKPSLPFILFTGKGREEVVIEAFNNGTDFYLQKGGESTIKFAELKDTIKKAVKIAERKKEFHDSETRYRRLFETARDGILILDAESGEITDANPLLLALLGYNRDELVGKNIWDLGVIREKSLAEQAAGELKKTGYIRYDDLPLKTKDGREVAVEFVSNAYDAETQKVIQVNIREITARKRAESALRESEERYNALFFNNYSISLLIDPDTSRIVDANNAAERYYGYSHDQLRSMGIYDLDRQPHDTVVRNLMRAKGEGAKHFFSTHYLASGEKRSVEIFSGPITVQGKTVFYSIIHDISDRKKAETALARSEVRNRTVLENVPDLILVHRNGSILYTNPPALEMTGYTHDELNNKPLNDLIVPEYRPLVTQAISKRMSGKTIEPYEIGILTKSGNRRTVVIRGTLIEFDGSPASLNVITDITERKKAEDALKKTSTLLNEVCEMGHVGGWELDVTTKEVLWTKETYRIHEISEDEKIDLSKAINFYDIPGRSIVEEVLQRCTEKGESFDLELPFTTIKGNHLWTRAMGHAVYEAGTVVKLTGTFQDITVHKTAEEAMKKFSEDLDLKVLERTSNLDNVNSNLMTEIEIRLNAEKQLSKNLNEKEVLLREVHHRVKNNLQIIISLLNLQSRYITDETTRSAFKESQNRVRAMALVHEKLYQSTDLATIDLGNYLKFLGDNLFQFLGMKGKGITLTMDIHDIFIAIDTAIPLGLMINELISNSLKYAFPEGRTGNISISIHPQDQTLTILYKDNGVGIREDFDWRNTKSMGLQLVTTLVDQLDGTIELDRTAGTTFTIVVKEKK